MLLVTLTRVGFCYGVPGSSNKTLETQGAYGRPTSVDFITYTCAFPAVTVSIDLPEEKRGPLIDSPREPGLQIGSKRQISNFLRTH